MPTPTPFINPSTIVTLFPGARFTDISVLLNIIVPILIIVAALLVLFFLAKGAYLYISSGESEENVEQARKTMTYAIFGIILVIASYLIVKIIGWITGVQIPI